MDVICKECKKIFSNRSHLNRHMKNVHMLIPTPMSYDKTRWNYKCLEENCNNSFQQNTSLIKHLKQIHKKAFDEADNLTFSAKTEFDSWKCKIELENKCNYVVSVTKGKVIYYKCNRTTVGKNLREDNNRQRRLKSQGSCKLNFACTSYIKLTIEEDQLLVQWQKEHYGHKFELQHLRISKEDKNTIASKLLSGVTKSEIIDSTRDRIGTSLKRVDLLKHKDIDNIKYQYKIAAKDGKKHRNDAMSLDIWVQECQSMPAEENPILLYKRQGVASEILNPADFCLIIMNKVQQMMFEKFGNDVIAIDGTHGLNNNDFELTTIMVIDEFGQGFPACYMFSNRKDTYIYELLFRYVRLKVGNVSGKTFMSDITDTFYNAWCRIMGPVTYRLLCPWHVDPAWQKNLAKIVDKGKRSEVYKTLKALQEELDEKRFKAQLMSALNLMLEDKDTADFGVYFKNNYAHICEQWAYCFRKSAGINTNMKLESMHKTIKYFHLDHKKVRRLDKALHAVLKFTRDKSVERMIKLVKGKNTTCHNKILKRHRIAVTEMNNDKIEVVLKDDCTWEICKKLNSKSETYFVRKQLNSSCCCLTCSLCEICLHMYSCTCYDYTCEYMICKHIHYIRIAGDKSHANNIPVASHISNENNNELLLSGIMSQTNSEKLDNNEIFLEELNQTFIKLQNSDWNNLSDERKSQIQTHLRIINKLVDSSKAINDDYRFEDHENKCPIYKNIETQQRFFSTQRKRKVNDSNKKPNKKERVTIINNLLSRRPEEFIVENSNNDHC